MASNPPPSPILATFADKHAFYAQFPASARGWDWKGHPGTAPLGSDVKNNRNNYLIVVCHAEGQPSGPVIAFDHATGEIHLLNQNLTVDQAIKAYP